MQSEPSLAWAKLSHKGRSEVPVCPAEVWCINQAQNAERHAMMWCKHPSCILEPSNPSLAHQVKSVEIACGIHSVSVAAVWPLWALSISYSELNGSGCLKRIPRDIPISLSLLCMQAEGFISVLLWPKLIFSSFSFLPHISAERRLYWTPSRSVGLEALFTWDLCGFAAHPGVAQCCSCCVFFLQRDSRRRGCSSQELFACIQKAERLE